MRGRLTCILIATILVLMIGGSSITQCNVESYQSLAVDSRDESAAVVSETVNELEYYREKLLERANMTLDDYEEMVPSDKERVDIYTQALWGLENGTLTAEEASEMVRSNSPMTVFAPGNILSYLDLLHWWGFLYDLPASWSVPRHDDEFFEIDFVSRTQVFERILRVDVVMDNGDWTQHLKLSKIAEIFPWTGHIGKTCSHNDPPLHTEICSSWLADTWGLIGHRGMCAHYSFMSDYCYFKASGPTGFTGNVKIKFQYQYQWWDPFKYWPWGGGWWDASSSKTVDRYWLSLGPNLYVHDDDEIAPEVADVWVHNEVDDDEAEIPYIYDTTGVLKIGGEALEGYLYPYEISSGIGNIDVKVDGQPVTYSWDASDEPFLNVTKSLDFRYSLGIKIPDPVQQLGLGVHTATISVSDGDNDREQIGEIDYLTSTPVHLQFEIREEQMDTTPPITTPMKNGEVGLEGWFTSDVYLSLEAEDDMSDIANTWFSYDQVTWTEYLSPILVTDQGSTTVYFQSEDVAGNVESIDSTTVMIDTISPSTSYVPQGTVGSEGWFVSDVLVALPSTDEGSGVGHTYCRINQGTWMEYKEPFWLRTTGTYEIDFYSVDKAGKTEDAQGVVLKIDQTPPETEAEIQGTLGPEEWYTSSIEVTLTCDDSLVGSGVLSTFYSIDGGPLLEYSGPFMVDLQGEFSIDFYSKDVAGNTEESNSEPVKIDTVAPVTAIDFAGDIGLNGWYVSEVIVTLTHDDSDVGSGVESTYYSINEGEFFEYTDPFLMDMDGTYDIDFYSMDIAGNMEQVQQDTLKIDTNDPSSILEFSPSLGENPAFVTSSTEFKISSSDVMSGVAYKYYSINGGEWNQFMDVFYLDGADGQYTISYYSVDLAGNEEEPQSSVVHLTSLQVCSYLTDGDEITISTFDNVFTKDKDSGGYKLVATNPGQIFYHIEISNNWPIAVNTLSVELSIPSDFVLKGTVPIHVFLDGIDITCQCMISDSCVTVTDIASGSVVSILIHLDYGLKGSVYVSLEDFGMKCYDFAAVANADSNVLIGVYDSLTPLVASQKKTTAIAGYVTESDGNPIFGAMVELYDSLGNLLRTTFTDENGFYYFIDIDAGTFTVKVVHESSIFAVEIMTVKNELTIADICI